jgi:hypothetical protein
MSRIFKKFLPEPTARKELTIDEIIAAWNARADQYNSWDSLDADERVNFVLSVINANALPARKPLTDDDIEAVYDKWNLENHKLGSLDGMDSFARAIEAKIREQSKPQSNAI